MGNNTASLCIYLCKRHDLSMRKVITLQANARPHTTAQTQWKLEKTLEPTPYSPELLPCDINVFGLHKVSLEGQRFNQDVEVEEYVRKRPNSTRTGYHSLLFARKNVLRMKKNL